MTEPGKESARRVELCGEYDFSRKEEISLLFGTLGTEGPVEIDMSAVSYIDSTFLHALTALHFRFKQWGVTLAGVSPQIRRILKMMNFEALFTITER